MSVMYIDINAISLCLDLNRFQQDESFCSKLGMELELAKSNLKTSLSQICVICQLLPFVRVEQYPSMCLKSTVKGRISQKNFAIKNLFIEKRMLSLLNYLILFFSFQH